MRRQLGVLLAVVAFGSGFAVVADPASAGQMQPLTVSGTTGVCLPRGTLQFTWVAQNNANEDLTIDSVVAGGPWATITPFSPNPVPTDGSATLIANGGSSSGPVTVTITVTYHGATVPTSTATASVDQPQCSPVCTPYPQCIDPTTTTTRAPTTTVSPTTAPRSTVAPAVAARPAFTG